MQKNLKIIHQLEHFLDRYQKTNNKISQQNIGWHIAHSCKVINSIAEAIYISNPENARPKFTFLYYWILITNKIPRGKAKAPSFVQFCFSPVPPILPYFFSVGTTDSLKTFQLVIFLPNFCLR